MSNLFQLSFQNNTQLFIVSNLIRTRLIDLILILTIEVQFQINYINHYGKGVFKRVKLFNIQGPQLIVSLGIIELSYQFQLFISTRNFILNRVNCSFISKSLNNQSFINVSKLGCLLNQSPNLYITFLIPQTCSNVSTTNCNLQNR